MVADSAPAYRVIRKRVGAGVIDFAELWRFRELFVFLAWRDILVRYKQTYLGVAWAVLQPFLTTVVFTVLFGQLAHFPTHGAPYAVITLSALLPWQFFSNALSESSNSIVSQARMISKTYFPRLIIPSSSVLGGTVDFLIGLVILAGFMVWYRVPIRPQLLLLPLFFAFSIFAALGAGFWLSALNVRYRDVKHIVPFITRIGFYVTPVGFLSALILDRFGERAFLLYSLNPMVAVIDGFRWCIFGSGFEPHWTGVLIGAAVTLAVLLSGLAYFSRTERLFADIV